MPKTVISIEEKEFTCRTLASNMPWVVIVDCDVEVSEFRGEVDIDWIEWTKISFLPESKYKDDDYAEFTSSFKEFKSLYHLFVKEDVDRIKESVEDEALDRLAND